MIKPKFNILEINYKTDPSTLLGKCGTIYTNTCALRMSHALVKTNPVFKKLFGDSSIGKKCAHSHVRGAQDLARILNTQAFRHNIGWHGNGSPSPTIMGKKGIICFMKIPGYSGQGHITLWNGKETVDKSGYWNSATIWFWSLT